MRTDLISMLSLVLIPLMPITLPGQTAQVIGRVHMRGDTTRAIPDAEVSLAPGARMTRSDGAGTFRFGSLRDGKYQLLVRRLGFAEQLVSAVVVEQHDVLVPVSLAVAPHSLAEINISGRRVLVPVRYEDAYRRVARGFGDFFTHATMDSLHALDMSSLLQTLPGVRVNERGVTFQRCEAGLSSKGIPGSISNSRMSEDTATAPRPHVQVYIDGVRVTNYSGRNGDDAWTVLRNIQPASLELVEVYRGVSRIPGEYLDDACAVILIWTK